MSKQQNTHKSNERFKICVNALPNQINELTGTNPRREFFKNISKFMLPEVATRQQRRFFRANLLSGKSNLDRFATSNPAILLKIVDEYNKLAAKQVKELDMFPKLAE